MPFALLSGTPVWLRLSLVLPPLAARLATLQEAGVELTPIADLAPFRRAIEPLYERYAADYGDLVERIRRAAAVQPASRPADATRPPAAP